LAAEIAMIEAFYCAVGKHFVEMATVSAKSLRQHNGQPRKS
jgi:hypothetical protein